MVKKDMELVDSSGYRIRLTLWGEDASNNDNIPDDSIIVAKVNPCVKIGMQNRQL